MDHVNIEHTPPAAVEYLALRQIAGLSPMSREGRRLDYRIACLPYVCEKRIC